MAGSYDPNKQGGSQNQTGFQDDNLNRKGGEASQYKQPKDDKNKTGRIVDTEGIDQDLDDDSDIGQI